jgi:hypothetical protein
MRGAEPPIQTVMDGYLAIPTAPQITNVAPNRCGEPMSRLKGAHALQGGKSTPFQRLVNNSVFPYYSSRLLLSDLITVRLELDCLNRRIKSSSVVGELHARKDALKHIFYFREEP